MKVPYSYLDRQFDDEEIEAILDRLRALARTGEFTIGPAVLEFEDRLAKMLGVRFVIGTNTGTDALILALKGLGVGPGDAVITQANTFYATVGAIVAVGARPVFVDVDDTYSIDVRAAEGAIGPRTRAILPVHWCGLPPDMAAVMRLARHRGLVVVEDACPALGAAVDGTPAGAFGDAAAFSMHPLKPLHVWGDGGAVATSDAGLAEWLRLYRNHGLVSRDRIAIWGVNQRLQSIQAVVANHVLDRVDGWIERRSRIAARLDEALADLPGVRVPPRPSNRRHAFQLYVVRAERREQLISHLEARGVEAKVHYPVPLHLQAPSRALGYKDGDFPVAEAQAAEIVTLPCHQYLTENEIDYMVECIRGFYGR